MPTVEESITQGYQQTSRQGAVIGISCDGIGPRAGARQSNDPGTRCGLGVGELLVGRGDAPMVSIASESSATSAPVRQHRLGVLRVARLAVRLHRLPHGGAAALLQDGGVVGDYVSLADAPVLRAQVVAATHDRQRYDRGDGDQSDSGDCDDQEFLSS